MNQIVLFDKAWDSIISLPKRIQQKLPDFMNKFRSNSRDPSLHLEPISSFADPQLRTARITDKYRVIIHAPKTGNLFHILHISNHDEAMDWAKNKLFSWNDFTHSYQVYSAPDAVGSLAVIPPSPAPASAPEKEILRGFSEQTDGELLAVGVPEVLLPSVREIYNAEQLEALYDFLPIEALENLSLLLEGAVYDTIIREVQEGRSDSSDREEQERSANNQRSFFELTDDTLLNEMLAGEVAKWRIFLHPSQQKLVEGRFKGPTKVSGGAGTGKTVAALHRARVLAERGEAASSCPIFFTTYTKSLSANLEEELNKLGVPNGLIRINNLDHFVINTAEKYSLIAPGTKVLDFVDSKGGLKLWREVVDFKLTSFDAEFLHAEYQNVILYQGLATAEEYYAAARFGRRHRISRRDKVSIWKLVEDYRKRRDEQGYTDLFAVYNLLTEHLNAKTVKLFRHVIADELQDFSNVHLRLLRALAAEQNDDLFLVGDPLQHIYDRRIIFSDAGINVRGRRSRRLRINYRTTEQIKKAAVSVIKDVDFNDFDGGTESKTGYVSLRGGEAPTYKLFRTSEEEIAELIDKISQYLEGNELGSLSPSDICIATRTRGAMKRFRTALHQAGIAYYDLTERQSPSGNREGGVWLSTFHNLKGLEFKTVFLLDVSKATFPFHHSDYPSLIEADRAAHDDRERALLYVALTRAIWRVHLSGVGEAGLEI
jgi:superfamily I DNA/RNA helicase